MAPEHEGEVRPRGRAHLAEVRPVPALGLGAGRVRCFGIGVADADDAHVGHRQHGIEIEPGMPVPHPEKDDVHSVSSAGRGRRD